MKTIKRIILMLQLYALDITISGQDESLRRETDPSNCFCIALARANARAKRARLRSKYNALFPVGQRRTWTMA